MRGRKPDANAIRRKDDHAQITPAAVMDGGVELLEKPLEVMVSPAMSDTWDLVVGSGLAYKPEDAPMLTQLVFDLEVARQMRDRCVNERGEIIAMVGKGQPDENGDYMDYKPNPHIKLMREAVAESMKLADQLGCTPLARARLGLTQAAGKAVTLSIAEQIDRAMRGAS